MIAAPEPLLNVFPIVSLAAVAILNLVAAVIAVREYVKQ